MVINTNTSATATANSLNVSSENLSRSLARLSSGSKIVRPSDDAAGLAVSSRLQAQLARLGSAKNNVSNAVSFIQTQDGFLSSIDKALKRMGELAMLAQDTTKSAADRELYNKEFVQLQEFIEATRTKKFNEVSLFSNGSLPVTVDSEGGTFSQPSVDLSTNAYGVDSASLWSDSNFASLGPDRDLGFRGEPAAVLANELDGFVYTDGTGTHFQPNSLSGYGAGMQAYLATRYPNFQGFVAGTDTAGWVASQNNYSYTGTSLTNNQQAAYIGTAQGNGRIDNGPLNPSKYQSLSQDLVSQYSGLSMDRLLYRYDVRDVQDAWNANEVNGGSSTMTLHPSAATATVDVESDGMSFAVKAGELAADLLTTRNAAHSLTLVQQGANDLARLRAEIGATESRLQFTADQLMAQEESLSASNSRITDVDVAQESTKFAREQILVQSGTSMLAQANALPQAALKLLQ